MLDFYSSTLIVYIYDSVLSYDRCLGPTVFNVMGLNVVTIYLSTLFITNYNLKAHLNLMETPFILHLELFFAWMTN